LDPICGNSTLLLSGFEFEVSKFEGGRRLQGGISNRNKSSKFFRSCHNLKKMASHAHNYLVFFAGSPLIKCGTNTQPIHAIRQRYITCYGKDIQLFMYEVESREVALRNEKRFRLNFEQYHNSHELFSVAGLAAMMTFLRAITMSDPIHHFQQYGEWVPANCAPLCRAAYHKKCRTDPSSSLKLSAIRYVARLNILNANPSDIMIEKYEIAWDDEIERWVSYLDHSSSSTSCPPSSPARSSQ
jgi:hypothetical protein